MFSLIHFSDPRFGAASDMATIEATLALIPDLQPNLVVVSGDMTRRARHGEFQAARVWTHELARTAPVYVTPGDRDVEWWTRPLIPVAPERKYCRYANYFGPTLAPTLEFTEAVIAGLVTAHGIAWRSLTPRWRDLAVVGHVERDAMRRVKERFAKGAPDQVRILVMHHNPLRGEQSEQMGVTRWKEVHRLLMEVGADVVLCGHDSQSKADVMGGVVISCAGSVTATGTAGGAPATFHRLSFDGTSVHIDRYEWESDGRVFRRTNVHGFAIRHAAHEARIPAGIV